MKKAQFFPVKDLNPSGGYPIVTILLLSANVIAFILEQLLNPETIILEYGFIPASFSFSDALTSMFLHGDIFHLLGNMWYLWIFGDNLEIRLGRFRYLLLYFLSGFAATFLHYITNINSDIPAIGASGAISGILGAYVVIFPKVQILTFSRFGSGRVPAFTMIGFWFVFQLISAVTSLFGGPGTGIAFWAHVGGFIFGASAAFVLQIGTGPNDSKQMRYQEGQKIKKT